MATLAASVMRFFRGSSGPAQGAAPSHVAQRLTRRSSGLAEVSRQLRSQEPLCILDLGPTSPRNIRYMTEMGHRIYSEDLLTASLDPALAIKDEQGQPTLDSKRFLSENVAFGPA